MEENALSLFDACNAVWIHDGDPKKPHAELTSSLCSNGYFNCSRVLKFPDNCYTLARLLVEKLKANGIKKVDWIIGSPYAAITFSYEVAKAFGAIHGFAEKDPQNPKKMVWQRFNIPEGSTVLQIEDVIVTGGTLREVRRAIEEGNERKVEFLPVIGTIVHRPAKLPANYRDVRVIALIEKEIWAVDPKDCPLCKAGSKRFRPKTHWKELTGKK